jgi:hypothetical protein
MTRQKRVVLAVNWALLGVGFAWLAAKCILDYDARGTGLILAALSVPAFVIAAWSTASAFPLPPLWDAVNGLGLGVLTTLLAAAFGVIAVRLVPWQAPAVRWACALGVAALAGLVAAAIPWLLSSGLHLAFVAARDAWVQIRLSIELLTRRRRPGAGPSARVDRASYAPSLLQAAVARTTRWQYNPSRRRLARCVAMGIGGMFFSLLAQGLCYKLDTSNQCADVYAPLLGWVVGSLVGWLAASWFRPSERPPNAALHVAHGFALASVAIIAMFALFTWGAAGAARGNLFSQATKQQHGGKISLDGRLPDKALSETFAPAFRFAKGEKWHPTSVKWYVDNSKQHTRCGGGAESCLVLLPRRGDCDEIDGRCAVDGAAKDSVVYASVNDVDREMPQGTDYAVVTRIVQYWVFYNYDVFDRGVVAQWHQSDWEQITVGIADGRPDEDGRPVFVGYSSHCFGAWLPWSQVLVADRTHPIVWVALGTHANYPRRFDPPLRAGRCGTVKPPPNFGLAGVVDGLIEAGGSLEVPVDDAVGLTDPVGDERRAIRVAWIPDPGHPPSGRANDIHFRGTWGVDNNLLILRKRSRSAAPKSPADHFEWKRPGAAMLCNEKWFHPELGRRKARALKDSCKLITGVPQFTKGGAYCFTSGPLSDVSLTCWSATDGKTMTLKETGGPKVRHKLEPYANGFTPNDYASARTGVVRLRCRSKTEDGKPPGCHTEAADVGGAVVFTCDVTEVDVSCSNIERHRFTIAA